MPGLNSNQRAKYVSTARQDFVLDTLSILPGSLSIQNIDSSFYSIDYVNARLSWTKKIYQDSIWVVYRVFPIKLNKKKQLNDYESVRYHFLMEQPVANPAAKFASNNPFADLKSLQTQGSLGRSISFGNSQDAVVNASLNLQMTGYIGDSLELTAAITDNNMPIQPEGNTSDLRDFDRIFLQIKRGGWQVNFGDIDISEKQNRFLNFNKRIQGVSFSTKNKWNDKWQNEWTAAGAIAKGKFTRNILRAIEGNQGPYRLTGANNELYFVVLAGTERVFIDGILMKRGDNQDYTINYNTAEITFTPKQFISKDKRIQVEFEYADRNYLNAQLFVSNQLHYKNKLDIHIAAFSNADAKNTTIDQKLNDAQKQLLADVGDSLQYAVQLNAVRDTFSAGKICYKKMDTVYNNGLHDSIFVFSVNNSDTLFRVEFSFVGEGKGNYRQLQNGSNGKVYSWVAPNANLVKQGNYAPVVYIIAPQKKQMISMGLQYHITNKTSLQIEGALSNTDVNLFATKHKADNTGFAGKFSFNHISNSFQWFKAPHHIEAAGSFEMVNQQFKTIERLRSVEFLRDWGLPFDVAPTGEKLSAWSVLLKSSKGGFASYELSTYHRSDAFKGVKHLIKQQTNLKGWNIQSEWSEVNFDGVVQKGDFFRPLTTVTKSIAPLRDIIVKLSYAAEINQVKNKLADSLEVGSFAFYRAEMSIQSKPQQVNKWECKYFTRKDWIPQQQSFISDNRSDNFSFATEIMKYEHQQVKINAAFRSLQVYQNTASNLKKDQTILGRVEYLFNLTNGSLNGIAQYELGGGQEQKKNYSYLMVPAGQGLYTWVDYNANGIEELNEFELAIFQDQKKYIRVYTPTNEYVKTNTLLMNYNIECSPGKMMKNQSSTLYKTLQRFTANSSMTMNIKKLSEAGFLLQPFEQTVADSSVISYNTVFTNAIYFNRTSTRWGLDITNTQLQNKALLTYGFEDRKTNQLTIKSRFNLSKKLVGNLIFRSGENVLTTTGNLFENRNYHIQQHEWEPALSYVYKSTFRATFSFQQVFKYNQIDSMESTRNKSFTTDVKFNAFSKSSITCKLVYNKILFKGYRGSENSAVGYMMLNGLLPGENYIWNIDFTKRLMGNIEMSVQYEGRKTADTQTVHIGRASVRAIF